MKVCKKCGKEIDELSQYCPYCGKNQSDKEGLLKRIFKNTRNYVVEEPKSEDSLIKFIVSSMNLAFTLLIVYAVLCGLYDFLGFFVYMRYGSFVDFIVTIPSVIGAVIVIIVSLRGIKEITKLGQEALENEKSKDILIKMFSGGLVFMGMMFLALLN